MCEIFDCSMDYLMGKSKQKNIEFSEFENMKNYYEKKFNSTLENKYFNKFRELGLTVYEVENLLKSIDTKEKLSQKQRHNLLISILSIIELNYDKNVLNSVKKLIEQCIQEKLDFLSYNINSYEVQLQKNRKELINEHIDKLHPFVSGKTSSTLDENVNALLSFLEKNKLQNFKMLPVYSHISSEQLERMEKYLEGYLPVDAELIGILNPEEYFFLKINSENMNKIIKNNAFALIHKQNIVKNGEIAIVLVEKHKEATLKKYTKQGQLVILESQSNDESFKTQVYDKNTNIKILGKYVGKMELNN